MALNLDLSGPALELHSLANRQEFKNPPPATTQPYRGSRAKLDCLFPGELPIPTSFEGLNENACQGVSNGGTLEKDLFAVVQKNSEYEIVNGDGLEGLVATAIEPITQNLADIPRAQDDEFVYTLLTRKQR